MNITQTRASHLRLALLLAVSLLFPAISRAAVTAVGVHLASTITGYQYVVPAGKVLIVEHAGFCDTWTGKPFAVRIQFSTNPTGPLWNSTINFTQNWNSLLRPIRIPSGKAVSIDSSYGITFKCFVFGLLVDEVDLYAGVPAAIQGLQVATSGEGQQVSGSLELQSPRPSHVVVQQSEDLTQWNNAQAGVQGTGLSPAQKSFSLSMPSTTSQAFFRAHGQTGEKWLPPLSPVAGPAVALDGIRP